MILDIDRYTGTHTLGPASEQCAAVWVHGCSRGCPGCIAAEWNAAEARIRLPARMLASVLRAENPEMRCIVISGGEPFGQPEALCELLDCLDADCKSAALPAPGVMIYTGYRLEELHQLPDPAVRQLLSRADILVDGRYVEALNDGKPYRGSSNQVIHFLTRRYSEADLSGVRRNSEIAFADGELSLSGIPDPEMRRIWSALAGTLSQKKEA